MNAECRTKILCSAFCVHRSTFGEKRPALRRPRFPEFIKARTLLCGHGDRVEFDREPVTETAGLTADDPA
jgi:hypothetical protein